MSQPRFPPTTRQIQVLAYMHTFLQINQQLPSCEKIASDFGWASENAAFDHLVNLERKGALGFNEVGNRMITPAGFDMLAEARP